MANPFSNSRRALAIGVLTALLGVACAPTLAGPPPPAPSQAKVQKNRAKRAPEKIVAPPPAYGNKVVMADVETDHATF